SGFARSAHEAGRLLAAVFTAIPVVMSFEPKYVLSASNAPGSNPATFASGYGSSRPSFFSASMLAASAISNTSAFGWPAANSAASLPITSVVPERNTSTSMPGYACLNAAVVWGASRSGCDVYSTSLPFGAWASTASGTRACESPAGAMKMCCIVLLTRVSPPRIPCSTQPRTSHSDVRGFDRLAQIRHEPRGGDAVDDAMVRRQRGRCHRPKHDLSVAADRGVDGPADGKDRTFRRIDDRRERVDAVHAEIGDRERPAAHLRRLDASAPRFVAQRREIPDQLPQRARVDIAKHRHDQVAGAIDRDADMDRGVQSRGVPVAAGIEIGMIDQHAADDMGNQNGQARFGPGRLHQLRADAPLQRAQCRHFDLRGQVEMRHGAHALGEALRDDTAHGI